MHGDPLVCPPETQALARLETVVHLNAGGLPLSRYPVSVSIPAAVWASARTETPDSLPVGWDADPSGRASIQFGSAWIRSMASALLRIPSVILPGKYNVLINPLHPDRRPSVVTHRPVSWRTAAPKGPRIRQQISLGYVAILTDW